MTEKKLKCGLIMPISSIEDYSEAHWEEVRDIIREALADTNFCVELVSDSNEVGIIQTRIVQNIYDNEITICDVSAKNPNVMFELGMRLAFDKPTIIIKDNITRYSFDTAPIEHLEYPRNLHYATIQSFKKTLKEKVIATYEASKRPEYTTFLKHFGKFVVAGIEQKEVGRDDFIIQSLNEIRLEIKSIKSERAKKEERSIENETINNELLKFNIDSINLDGLDEIIKSKKLSDENFIQEYAKRKGIEVSSLASPDSPLFSEFLDEYLSKSPKRSRINYRHEKSTRDLLLKAIAEISQRQSQL